MQPPPPSQGNTGISQLQHLVNMQFMTEQDGSQWPSVTGNSATTTPSSQRSLSGPPRPSPKPSTTGTAATMSPNPTTLYPNSKDTREELVDKDQNIEVKAQGSNLN